MLSYIGKVLAHFAAKEISSVGKILEKGIRAITIIVAAGVLGPRFHWNLQQIISLKNIFRA